MTDQTAAPAEGVQSLEDRLREYANGLIERGEAAKARLIQYLEKNAFHALDTGSREFSGIAAGSVGQDILRDLDGRGIKAQGSADIIINNLAEDVFLNAQRPNMGGDVIGTAFKSCHASAVAYAAKETAALREEYQRDLKWADKDTQKPSLKDAAATSRAATEARKTDAAEAPKKALAR